MPAVPQRAHVIDQRLLKSAPVPTPSWRSSDSDTDATTAAPSLECPICLDTVYRPVAPPCGHPMCRECFDSLRKASMNPACPVCRVSASSARLMPVTHKTAKVADPARYKLAREVRGCVV